MEIPKIHEGEYRFCLILWEHEPLPSAELAKLCRTDRRRAACKAVSGAAGMEADHDVYSHQAAWGARRPEK